MVAEGHHNAIIIPCLQKYVHNDTAAAAEHFVHPSPSRRLNVAWGEWEGGLTKNPNKIKKLLQKALPERLIVFQQMCQRMVELRLYTLPFCGRVRLFLSNQWEYKKALLNSRGKLSLKEGPAQTGRAGLGFSARGFASFPCVYAAELALELSLHLALIQSLKSEGRQVTEVASVTFSRKRE